MQLRLGLRGKALWKQWGNNSWGPFDIQIEGLKLRLYPLENFSDRTIMMYGLLPERFTLERFMGFVPRGGVFIDIGANIGVYSMLASAQVGSEGRVLAFEPLAETADKFTFNVAANERQNVTLFRYALGAEEGQTDFFPSIGKNAGRSSCLAAAVSTPGKPLSVQSRTLFAVLLEEGIDRIDALKIDVEGYEDRILKPFFENAPAAMWPKALLMELEHADLWETTVLAKLEGFSYVPVLQCDDNILLVRK